MDARSAQRLAGTIATLQYLLLGLTALGVVAGVAGADGAFTVVFLLDGIISAVSIHVMCGWFEHTLRLLIGIACNTAEAADLMPGGHE